MEIKQIRHPVPEERKGMKPIENEFRQLRLELVQKNQPRQRPIPSQNMGFLMNILQTLFGFYAIAYMSYVWALEWLLWNWTSDWTSGPLRWLILLGGASFGMWTLVDISLITEQLIPGMEYGRSNKVLGWYIGCHILGEGILVGHLAWYDSTEVWPPVLWPMYFSLFMTVSLAATHGVQVMISRRRRQ
jgi:hypothetical protein